jgi:predicted ester cyclase
MYKKGSILFFISLVVVLISCQSNQHNPMEAKYKAAYLAVNQIMDSGNTDELDAYIAADAVDHQLDPNITTKTGLAGIKDVFTYYHKIFPDMKTTVHSVAVSGDTLFGYISSTGTTSEPFMGMSAGQQQTMNMVDVVVFKGDKMAEHWGFMDMTDAMKMMQSNMPDESMMEGKSN